MTGSALVRIADGEVREILRRAAAADLRADVHASGATLPDLMAAAEEAGLDPGDIRRAAAIRPVPPGGAARVLLGASDRRELRALLTGARLPASRHAVMRAAESVLGTGGTVVTDDPGRFIWRQRPNGSGVTLELVDAPDGVEVRIEADRARSYLGLWAAGLVGWAALSALTPLGAALGVVGTLVGFVVAPPLLARPFWARADQATLRRLEHVAMEAMRTVEEEAGEPG